ARTQWHVARLQRPDRQYRGAGGAAPERARRDRRADGGQDGGALAVAVPADRCAVMGGGQPGAGTGAQGRR
ncbi:hypothetical protein ABTE28_20815, partial [Acinetobacter baumannii]